MLRAIGMIELTSIAKGINTVDAMLKTADVQIISATPVCPGKFIAIVHGDVAAVESAVQAGRKVAGEYLVDEFILANVHPGVFPAITATSMPKETGALGIIESFSVASMIVAADFALKAANVEAMELRLGSGLGGKAYFTFTGDVAAVEASVEAGAASVKEKGLLVETVVIPSPMKALWNTLY